MPIAPLGPPPAPRRKHSWNYQLNLGGQLLVEQAEAERKLNEVMDRLETAEKKLAYHNLLDWR